MKAFVITEPLKAQWNNIEQPTNPGSQEVIIKVKAAGICGTDVHIWHGKHGAVTFPRIPGHELVGEVLEVGSDVEHVKVGDRVAVDPVVSCGQCALCKSDKHNICHQVKCLGVQTEGGFTEVIKVSADRTFVFSNEVDWDVAALVEPFSIAAQIGERLRLDANDKVLVVGAGTIGLAVLQTIQGIYGAATIVADISAKKLEMATDMGAKAVVNPKETNAIEKAAEIWDNQGPTVVIDAVGNTKILKDLCMQALPGTRIGVIGFMADELAIPPVEITKRELELIGSRMNNNKFPDVLRWFKEGKVDAAKLISHKYKFTDIEKAFDVIDKQPDEVCKVILEF